MDSAEPFSVHYSLITNSLSSSFCIKFIWNNYSGMKRLLADMKVYFRFMKLSKIKRIFRTTDRCIKAQSVTIDNLRQREKIIHLTERVTCEGSMMHGLELSSVLLSVLFLESTYTHVAAQGTYLYNNYRTEATIYPIYFLLVNIMMCNMQNRLSLLYHSAIK